jgi:Domain of unknown function (DUF4783)
MKFSFLILLLLSFGFTTPSKLDNDISIQIKNAIKVGDAHQLSLLFDQNLELVIDSEKVDFDKINNTHAELILKSFFKKKPPQSFYYEYQGSTASIRYCTGNYRSGAEQFWVYIIIKNKKSGLAIGSIHFKKDQKV